MRFRKHYGGCGDTWHVDEVFVRIGHRQCYLYRAADQDGDVIDVMVQTRRDKQAAERFFRMCLKKQRQAPRRLVTDKLRSYRAAHREVMSEVIHDTERYSNNRAEISHQSTRQRERYMRRFKSLSQAQHFLSVHGMVQNLFRFARHVMCAKHYRLFRMRSFVRWQQVTCA